VLENTQRIQWLKAAGTSPANGRLTMTKADTPTHGDHDARKQHGAAGKTRGKARAHCDRRAEYTVLATDAGNALPATLEQQRVDHAAAAAKPAKPVKSSKLRKPAKRRRRPKRRKAKAGAARRKARAASASRKPRKPPIPKFPNSPPRPTNEPAPIPAAEQVEREPTAAAPPSPEPGSPAAPTEGNGPTAEQTTKDDPSQNDDSAKAKRAADAETCRGQAWRQWSDRIIGELGDAVRENLASGWPPANSKLHEEIAKAQTEEIPRLFTAEAENRGFSSLMAGDFKRVDPSVLWKYLKRHYRQNRPQTSSSEPFKAWVAEKVEQFQSRFLRQEQVRRLDDLDDEERRIEDDIDAALDKAVEKAARDFNMDTATIWDALVEGFRNHPMLADIVDDVPGKIIWDKSDEFRVTEEPYSVWARFGERPGQAPGRIVFTWARIFKVALIPDRHSTDLDNKRPWHHFQMQKREGSRLIEREVVIPSELVVKGSAPGAAIKYARKMGARVYMRAGQEKAYGAKILRFLDWEPTRRIGKRLPGIGWHNMADGRVFLMRPDRAVLPASARAPVPVDHEHVDPEIVYQLDSQAADGWRGEMKGSAEGWRHHAARHAQDSNVVFGVGVVLAASMMKYSSEWARIHNDWGLKKIAKSAVFQIIQALVGKPYRPGCGGGTFGFGLHATSNKVVERALHRNDFGLLTDEHGNITTKMFADLVYPLVAGEEKGRHGREEQSFSTMVLMNGEKSFLERVQDAGLHVNPGQFVRVIDHPAEVRPGSALESVSGDEIERVSKQIYDWTMQHYGYPGLEWQQHIVDLQSGRIRDESDRGMGRWLSIPEVRRVPIPPGYSSMIGGFALPAAALEMARLAKVLPSTWTRETNDSMALACLERWVDVQIVAERQVREKIVTDLREGRFISLRKTAGELVGARPSDAADLAGDWEAQIKAGERWGFVKIDDRHTRICIALAAFEDLCGGRLHALELANRFRERGWLERDGDRLTKNEMIREGRTIRCYVLRAAFLGDDAEALLAQNPVA